MALRSSAPQELPKDAIVMDENEAILHQWTIVRSWPKMTDVWPFRLGIPLLGLAATIGGLTINEHFRRKLKLHRYGKLSTSFAMGLTPAVIISAAHCIFVTHDIYINKSKCLLCLQQRAMTLQVGFGVCYPIMLSPLANFMYSTRHGTYRLPYWGDYKGTLKLWWRFVKAGKEKFIALILFEAFISAFISYKEKESLLNIQLQMFALEAELLAELKAKKNRNQLEKQN